jgi:hypothetical protein
MSEPEPSRPRFRLQTLMFIVIILGLVIGIVLQRIQFVKIVNELKIEVVDLKHEAERERVIAKKRKARAGLQKRALAAAWTLIQEPRNKDIVKLAMFSMLHQDMQIRDARPEDRIQFRAFLESPGKADTFAWEGATIAYIHCGIGGGFTITIAMNDEGDEPLSIILPGM